MRVSSSSAEAAPTCWLPKPEDTIVLSDWPATGHACYKQGHCVFDHGRVVVRDLALLYSLQWPLSSDSEM